MAGSPASTDPAAAPASYAGRLAQAFVAARGFAPAVVPEAQALIGAAHYVLSAVSGLSYTLVCIVDRERDRHAIFGLPPAETAALAEACVRYSGTLNGQPGPVTVHIVEVSAGAPDEAQLSRLSAYKRPSLWRRRYVPIAWAVDTQARTVWTSAPLNGRAHGRRLFERVFDPADDVTRPVPAAAFAPARRPIVTWALIALMAFIFFGPEQMLAPTPGRGLTPSVDTLAALGGLDGLDVRGGESWRLITAALLHGGPTHLLFNGIALTLAGQFLEPLVGRAWFFALFVLGAVGGGLMSLALNPDNVVSIGASGAIMGLLAAGLVTTTRLPRGIARTNAQVRLSQVLVPSLLPLATTLGSSEHVDYGAHLGGTLMGVLAGVLLRQAWPREEPLPRWRGLALAIGAAGVATAAWAALRILQGGMAG